MNLIEDVLQRQVPEVVSPEPGGAPEPRSDEGPRAEGASFELFSIHGGDCFISGIPFAITEKGSL